MATTSEAAPEAGPSATSNPGFTINDDQLAQYTAQIIAAFGRNNRESTIKVKEPDTFDGDQKLLRTWLVQLQIIFDAQPEKYNTDEKRINLAKTCLKGKALVWITPVIEGKREATWTTWPEFKKELETQFGDPEAETRAANEIERLKQGNQPFSSYWSSFSLLASELNYTEATYIRLMLKNMNSRLQNQYIQQDKEFETSRDLAAWANRQEARLAQMDQLISKPYQAQTRTPTNPTVNHKPLTTTQGGDAMDIDAASSNRYGPRLTKEEHARRMRNNLCLKCAKPGHRARFCRSTNRNFKANAALELLDEEEDLKEEGQQESAAC